MQRRQFLKYSGSLAASGITAGVLAGCGDSSSAKLSADHTTALPAKKLDGKYVRTVAGPMSPEHLGITSMHEHVLLSPGPGPLEAVSMFDAETLVKAAMLHSPEEVPQRFFPEPDNPVTLESRHHLKHYYANAEGAFDLNEELMTAEIGDFAQLGGGAILDVSVPVGRGDPEAVRRMSEKTGLDIVMSTGIDSHVLLAKRYKNMDLAELVEFFETELHIGMGETSIPAGNIKLLAESEAYGVKASEDVVFQRALEAAANVSANSGVPVTVHAYLLGDDEYRALLARASEVGMPQGRMVLAHFPTALRPMDYRSLLENPNKFAPNLDIGFEAMDKGFILSFDLFGAGDSWVDSREGFVAHYDPYSIAAIYQYTKAGYADRMVLGTDVWTRTATRRHGGGGIAQLLNFVVPTLREYGVSQPDIDQMLIGNPARILAY